MEAAEPGGRVRAALAGNLPSENLTAAEAQRFDAMVNAKIDDLLPVTNMRTAGTGPAMHGVCFRTVDGQTTMEYQLAAGRSMRIAISPTH